MPKRGRPASGQGQSLYIPAAKLPIVRAILEQPIDENAQMASRQVLLQLRPDLTEQFDRYSPAQINQLLNFALQHYTPDTPLGAIMLTIVRPPQPITKTIVRLRVRKQCIQLVFPEKRDDFRSVVVGLQYEWESWCWQRTFTQEDALMCDRAAEIAHKLLLAGFCVQVEHIEVREKVIAASYNPECFRWVDAFESGVYQGWFTFRYLRSENFYDHIMRITAAKYINGKIHVPPEHFAEVLDFADRHEFTFTLAAQAAIEQAQLLQEAALIVIPIAKANCKSQLDLSAPVIVPQSLLDLNEIETSLLEHQEPVISKLRSVRVGGLFMDLGTGKTRCAIEFVALRRNRIDRVVYCCPIALKETIAQQLKTHIENPLIYVFDDKTQQGKIPSAFWYIVGIESLSQSDRVTLAVHELISDATFVVLDESDTCKNHLARRTQRITRLAQQAKYRLILTGTAVSEGIEDLYAQMYFLSPEILGYKSFYSFAVNHLEYSDKYPGLVVNHLNTAYIAQRLDPYVFQCCKDECMSLPNKLYESRHCSMSLQQWELYDRAKCEILLSVPDDEINSYTIFRLFTALREIVSGFWNRTLDPQRQYKSTQKAELLTCDHNRLCLLQSAVTAISNKEKIIIWSNFHYSSKQIALWLTEEFGAEAFAEYDGRLAAEKRERSLIRWRNEARFLLASPKCGGRGLTLNECAYQIFYNNDFPYRLREQCENRNHRIGQTRRPTYIDLICRSSIDEKIFQALCKKESFAKAFKRQLDKLKQASDCKKLLLSV